MFTYSHIPVHVRVRQMMHILLSVTRKCGMTVWSAFRCLYNDSKYKFLEESYSSHVKVSGGFFLPCFLVFMV
jgi:hypothetical protein